MTIALSHRHSVFSALMVVSLFCGSSTDVFAQAGTTTTTTTQAAPPSNSRPLTKPMYVQGAVVVALMGGAIFAVCRSSRRV